MEVQVPKGIVCEIDPSELEQRGPVTVWEGRS